MPSGLLPALELDGRLVTESAAIMRLLEEAFPDATPLLPPVGSKERPRADALLRLERRLFSDWLSWLCSAWCAALTTLHEHGMILTALSPFTVMEGFTAAATDLLRKTAWELDSAPCSCIESTAAPHRSMLHHDKRRCDRR